MVLAALDEAGGIKYLVEQARANPAVFLTLIGKILPLQVTGKDDGPIEHRLDVPAKETREEWLARHRAEAERSAVH